MKEAPTRICENCKNEYKKPASYSVREWAKKRFCSRQCRSDFSRITKKCPMCGKDFSVYKAMGFQICCSRKCNLQSMPQPREAIPPKLCENCGKEYFRKGKKARDNSRFCSLSCKFSGKQHWNWKGGIAPENSALRQTKEYHDWRFAVYTRDYWTCQHCGKKERNDIVAHHLKAFADYPELRHDINNGITLCRSCHKGVHEEIGKDTRFKTNE